MGGDEAIGGDDATSAFAEVTPGWRFVSIGFEGDAVDIGGINPWKASWEGTGGSIVVAHPSYPWERHDLAVYTADGSHGPVTFAAGEYSNGVWGFFVPSDA